jgi:hypothetical protein
LTFDKICGKTNVYQGSCATVAQYDATHEPKGGCNDFLCRFIVGLVTGDVTDLKGCAHGKWSSCLALGLGLTPGGRAAKALKKAKDAGKAARTAKKKPPNSTPRRKSAAQLRKEWEAKHRKPWPKDKKGNNYDAHHSTPLADGGKDDVDNVMPKERSKHVKHHKKKGDYARWGKRRR